MRELTKDDIPDYAPGTIEMEDGGTVTVRVEPDEHMGPPWEEHDGHGIVSEWTRRAKAPGELVLAEDRGSHRFYDFAATVKLARKDQWGAEGKTPGERAARAAMEDFRRLRAWCRDEWQWVGVVVEVRRSGQAKECADTFAQESLWGIESDGDYWREIAAELANELLA